MKPIRTLILSFLVLLLISCAFFSNVITQPASEEITSIPLESTTTPVITLTAQNEITAPEVPSEQLTASPQAVKPRSLYFLSGGAVWIIRPETQKPEQITPSDSIVTNFDVWPPDGRLAYSTKSGKLYSVLPDSSPVLVFQLEEKSILPTHITGLDWSPKGDSLAFTVGFSSEDGYIFTEYPSYPSGLWKIDVYSREAVWLKSNHHMRSIDDDVNAIEVLVEPVWSPDGMSILVSGYYWEWMNKVWVYPLEYADDSRNMHSVSYSPSGDFESWRSASWMPDSSGLLISGMTYAAFSDLIWADRQTAENKPLIGGELANLYIFEAYAVPPESYLPGEVAGIHSGPDRYLFLAECPPCENNTSARLYVQKFIDGSLQGQAVGPEFLCTGKDDYGNNELPPLHRMGA
ncbi:MAG: TolB family protein [Anaerolineaceae bacterium]